MASDALTTEAVVPRKLPRELAIYLSVTLALTLLALVALLYYIYIKHSPLDAQMWSESRDRFGDFFHYQSLFASFHSEAFFTAPDRFAYPAPCAVLYSWFFHLGTHAHPIYDDLLVLIALLSAIFLYAQLRAFGLANWKSAAIPAFLLITSHPWLMLWDRGNLELFVYALVAAGVWAYLADNHSLAAALWGCAGAMKIYPLALLAMFIRRMKWRPLLVGLATCAAILLASFWYVGPTIHDAAMGSLHGITGFVGHYAGSARRSELDLDHTLLAAIKEILSLNILHLGESWPKLSLGYQAIVMIVVPTLFFIKAPALPALNRLCLLLVAIVLLPPVSYDYTLIHIYLVLGIVLQCYLAATLANKPFPGARLYFLCFALLFTSQAWIQLRGLRINGILKCAALLLLSGLLLHLPLTMESGNKNTAAAETDK